MRLFVIITDAAAPFAYDDTLEIARVKKSSDRLLVNFHRSASFKLGVFLIAKGTDSGRGER